MSHLKEIQQFEASRQLLEGIDVPTLLAAVQQADPKPEDQNFTIALVQDKPTVGETGEIDTSCRAVLETKKIATDEKGIRGDGCNLVQVVTWKSVTITADASRNVLSIKGEQTQKLTPIMEYSNPDILKQTLCSALDRPESRGYRMIPSSAWD